MKVNRREYNSGPDKTTQSKFTCVGNETFWKVNGNMLPIVMATEVLNEVNPIGKLVDKPTMRSDILHLLHAAVQYAHTADRTATAWKHLLVPDEELLALLAKARQEHTKGNLFENNGPDLDNAADEDPEGDDLHEDEVQDWCMREGDVKVAEEEEAPAEPSPLPAADAKEPVTLAPEQALKPAQRMCKFFRSPSGLWKSECSGSSSSPERVSLAMKMI